MHTSSAFAKEHNYYGSTITSEQAAQADAIAKKIASDILANPSYATDFDKITAATDVVVQYGYKGIYGNDKNKYYRSPYGVFISGNFTCAGSVRALGRILDFMGYEWEHVNENQWSHQWVKLDMDGKHGYADPSVRPHGLVGFGERPDVNSSVGTVIIPIKPRTSEEKTFPLKKARVGDAVVLWGAVANCKVDNPSIVQITPYHKDGKEKSRVSFIGEGDVTITNTFTASDGVKRTHHNPYHIDKALPPSSAPDTSGFEDTMFQTVNFIRERSKVPPMTMSAKLNELATLRAKELAVSYSHTRPDGSSISDVLGNISCREYIDKDVNNSNTLYQNISSNHEIKQYLLNSNIKQIGLGMYLNPDNYKGFYFVMIVTE